LDSGTAAEDLHKVTVSRTTLNLMRAMSMNQIFSQLPYRIAQVHAPEELPTHIIVVYSSGKVDLLDGSLHVSSASEGDPIKGSRFLKSFLFPSLGCNFIPPRERAAGSICLVIALARGSKVVLQIHCISSTGPCLLTELAIPEVELVCLLICSGFH
jgi:hypothetical protein